MSPATRSTRDEDVNAWLGRKLAELVISRMLDSLMPVATAGPPGGVRAVPTPDELFPSPKKDGVAECGVPASKFVCEVAGCGRSLLSGDTMHRVNAKGQPGIWRCDDHLSPEQKETVDPVTRLLERTIGGECTRP